MPDAKLPQMPAARVIAPTSRPSRREARYVTPNVAKRPDGWNPRRWNCPGDTLPARHEISLPSATAAIRSRPETRVVSAMAHAAATDGLLMWTIDSLCVSSYSSACENAPLANAAIVTPTASPVPRIRAGPPGEIATAASRTDRPNGVTVPASARPITSSTRCFVACTTSGGRSSKDTRAAHCARSDEIGIRLDYLRRVELRNHEDSF